MKPVSRGRIQCHNCRQVGHTAENCWRRQASQKTQWQSRADRREDDTRSHRRAAREGLRRDSARFRARQSRREETENPPQRQNCVGSAARSRLYDRSLDLLSGARTAKATRNFLELCRRHSTIDPCYDDYFRSGGTIYVAMHMPTGSRYVGQTQRPLDERIAEHLVFESRQNVSGLTHHWIKHPRANEYIILPLAHCPASKLIRLEDKYIEVFNPSLNTGRDKVVTRKRGGKPAPPPRMRERDLKAKVPKNVDTDAAERLAEEALRMFRRNKAQAQSFLAGLTEATFKKLKIGLRRLPDQGKDDLEHSVALEHRRRAAVDFVSVEFASAWMDQDILKACLQADSARKFWPWDPQSLRELKFRYHCTPTLGAEVFNFAEASAALDDQASPCGCHLFDGHAVNKWRGHVVGPAETLVASIANDDPTRRLAECLAAGAKFRFSRSLEGNLKALERMFDGMERSLTEKPKRSFKAFREAVLAEFKKRYEAAGPGSPAVKPDFVNALTGLQRVLVFCPTDKSPQSVACVCRKLYQVVTLEALHSSAFEPLSAEQAADVITRVQAKVESLRRKKLDGLPYTYVIPKFHKNMKEGWRVLSGSRGRGAEKFFEAARNPRIRLPTWGTGQPDSRGQPPI